MQGWISLHRQIKDNFIWNDKPFSKGHAWIDILLRVNHQPNKVPIGNQVIDLIAGQTVWSIKDMATSWGWSRTKVDAYLKVLNREQMLDIKKTSKYTLLTVINWEMYQHEEGQKSIKKASKKHQKSTNNNDNNDINKIYSLWNDNDVGINHKKLTKDMSEAIDTKIKKHSFEVVKTAISRLCKAVHDENYYYDIKWSLKNFMQQKNGLPNWLDEGQIWNNYCSKKKGAKQATNKVGNEALELAKEFHRKQGVEC